MTGCGDLSGRRFETAILPNGIRVICCRTATRAEYFGVAVNSGSRDERAGCFGLAHFVEHTIFKGTTHRRACHIINRMEAVGGELNAFTSKEETYVYTIFPNGNLGRAVDLVADLVRDSVFPAAELDRERDVVRDEMDSYLDTPSEAVFDDFEDLFFRGSQLGHNILGNSAGLDTFTSDVCRRYLTETFCGSRLTVFYLGPEPPCKVVTMVTRQLGMLPAGIPAVRVAPQATAAAGERRPAASHQANTVIGAQAGSIYEPDRHAMALLANILGGPGMNSRLNVALRERRGLVYTVEAAVTRFTDCGVFTVYYGCDPGDNDRCHELVNRELARMADTPLKPSALAAAKRQYLGQLVIGSENLEQSAMNMARTMMYFGHAPSVQAVAAAIEAVTPMALADTAQRLRPDLCSRLTLG